MKHISSQPDAAKFRSIVVVILVLICISLFLVYTNRWERALEDVSVERVINNLNSALSVTTYQYIIKNKQQSLVGLDGENPFVYLAIHSNLPVNYYGTRDSKDNDVNGGWFFVKKDGLLYYRYKDKKRIRAYRVKFYYQDVNETGKFEMATDRNYYLKMEESTQ